MNDIDKKISELYDGELDQNEIDSLLEQGRSTIDPQERKKYYNKVQEILQQDLPYISLWHNQNVALVKENIDGFRLHPSGGFQSLVSISRR